jgi:hypothetical protein
MTQRARSPWRSGPPNRLIRTRRPYRPNNSGVSGFDNMDDHQNGFGVGIDPDNITSGAVANSDGLVIGAHNAGLREVVRQGYASLTHTAEQIQASKITQKRLCADEGIKAVSRSVAAEASFDDSDSDRIESAVESQLPVAEGSQPPSSDASESMLISTSIHECLEEFRVASIQQQQTQRPLPFDRRSGGASSPPWILNGAPLTITSVQIVPQRISSHTPTSAPDRVHVYWTLPGHLWMNQSLSTSQKEQLVDAVDSIISGPPPPPASPKVGLSNHQSGPLRTLLRRLEQRLQRFYGGRPGGTRSGSQRSHRRNKPYPVFRFHPDPHPEKYFRE